MQHQNIPAELKKLRQWVCVDMSPGVDGKPKKHPINPRTGSLASVTEEATWGSFEEVIGTGAKYIGLVLTDSDPYAIIDLDNKAENPATLEQLERHASIIDVLQTYTERSVSGTGYHLICKGSIPHGVNRDKVEIYSSGRYMICTGDVISARPIIDAQDILMKMYEQMREDRERAILVDNDAYMTDSELIEMASDAVNGDKFDQLCAGDWQDDYRSQSEADLALMSMLAFYSKDNEQCRRIFRMTPLGQREKAQRNDTYLNYTLSRCRANEPPPVDLSFLNTPQTPVQEATPPPPPPAPLPPQAAPIVALPKAVVPSAPSSVPGVRLPSGLIGEIAQFIFSTAIRPVPEVALVSAVALVAGIAARSYNISGSGLNQYLILLAKTGSGKEGGTTGIDMLIDSVCKRVPMADKFIGPSAFASGQALVRVLDERPCFVSVLGEVGITLQQMCDPKAPAALVMLKKVLLDVYGKSGWHKILRQSVYADTEKNTKIVQAPNVTIYGESTPETFFDGLNVEHIAEGLIPRFSVIEYTGKRPPRNPNANRPPAPALVEKLVELVTVAMTTTNNGTCCPVGVSSEAGALLDAFDTEADANINNAEGDVILHLWNRAHLKALKLAALVAVGVNPHNPAVDAQAAQWAIDMVRADIALMIGKFQENKVGQGEHRQEEDVIRAVTSYLSMDRASRIAYRAPLAIVDYPVIPFAYIRRRLRLLSSFKNDPRGTARAIEESLRDLCKAEILQQIPPRQVREKYSLTSEMYVAGSNFNPLY